jgi:hypothetical protein
MRVREFLLVFAPGAMSLECLGQSRMTSGIVLDNAPDETGGSLPESSVEPKNLDANYATATGTSEEGHFVLLSLTPGRYALTVSKQGFATVLLKMRFARWERRSRRTP